jgi:hypothetical protein
VRFFALFLSLVCYFPDVFLRESWVAGSFTLQTDLAHSFILNALIICNFSLLGSEQHRAAFLQLSVGSGIGAGGLFDY